MRRTWMALAAAVILATGCSKNTMSELKGPASAETAAKPTLDVQVETSDRNATVTVTTNMKISEEHVGMTRVQGEGHIHLYVDGGEKVVVTDSKYVIKNLQPGKHQVNVSLHNNDHTPYDVGKQVEFEIK